jgi:hypothetical protein
MAVVERAVVTVAVAMAVATAVVEMAVMAREVTATV